MTTIIITPPLILFSVPLFFFALLTTSLACLVLGLRVSIVYVELFVSVVQDLLSPSRTLAPYVRKRIFTLRINSSSLSSSSSRLNQTLPSSPTRTTRSLRRTSSATTSSPTSSKSGNTTPKALSFASNDPLSYSGIYMSGSAAATTTPLNRDFEGVGGWRMPATTEEAAEDAEREEELWTGMNKRLELPVPVPIMLQRSAASSRINLREEPDADDRGKNKKHKRRATGGTTGMSQRVRDGVLRMTGCNSRDIGTKKHKGKEPQRDISPHSKSMFVGKERKNKSMVTLGEAWTANVGRSMATTKRL